MSYMYYCPNCNKLYKAGEKGKKIKCSKCAEYAVDMNISSDDYTALDSKQRQALKGNYEDESLFEESMSDANPKSLYMYCCPKCRKFYKKDEEESEYRCVGCQGLLVPLKVTDTAWTAMNNEEKKEINQKAIESARSSKKEDNSSVSQNEKVIEKISSVTCPKCGASVPEKSKFCLECGYNFEVKNIQKEGSVKNSFFDDFSGENSNTISYSPINNHANNADANDNTHMSGTKKKRSKLTVVLCSTIGGIVLIIGILLFFYLRGETPVASIVSEPVDPLAQRVIDKIDALGDIDVGDIAAIEEIKTEYSELTDSQKNQVHNYIVILEAGDKISEMNEERAETEPANFIIESCTKLKSELKNPDSLQINRILYTDILRQGDYRKSETFAYLDDYKLRFLEIDYSAENSMGGRTNDIAHIEYYTGDSDTINIYTDSELNSDDYVWLLAVEIKNEFYNVSDAKKFYEYDDTDFILSCLP